MAFLINIVLPVFLIVGIAALAYTRLKLEGRTLSRAAFYLFTPPLLFDALVTSDASGTEFAQVAAVVVLTTLVMWLLGALSARLLRLEGPTQAAFLVAILVINAGNYGLSVNLFAFGEAGLARASIYFTIMAAVGASLGVYLSARGRAPIGMALRRMAGVPFVYAAVLGLAFNLANITVPEPIMKAIHLLGQASVPTMLTVLGIRLAQTFQTKQRHLHLPALGVVTVARLVIAPLLALGFSTVVGLQGLARDVTVLQSAMPSAVIGTILATEFETDSAFAALCVLVTTLISIPTVTLWLNLLSGW